MLLSKIYKLKPDFTEVLSLLFLFAACVLLTIGGIFYTNDRYKVLNYVNTRCEVRSVFWNSVQYIQSMSYYYHYVPKWTVKYDDHIGIIQGTDQYDTPKEALAQSKKYGFGSFHSCWYDRKRLTVAQWEKPNTHVASALVSFGTISLFLSIVCLFLTHLLIRKNERDIADSRVAHVHVTFLK